MKSLIVVLLSVMITSATFAQKDALASYFKQYLEDERFTFIEISPRMFQMIAKFEPEDQKAGMELIRSISSFRMITSDKITDGHEMFNQAMRLISTRNYVDLLTVQTGDERIRIMVREEGDIIRELFMVVAERKEIMMMSITGNIDLNQLSRLGGSLNIEGLDKLGDIKK